MKIGFITQLGHEPVRIDILNDLDAVSFNNAWNNRKVVSMLNVPVSFIGLKELIIVKEKAGRKQDIADVDKLKKRNRIQNK